MRSKVPKPVRGTKKQERRPWSLNEVYDTQTNVSPDVLPQLHNVDSVDAALLRHRIVASSGSSRVTPYLHAASRKKATCSSVPRQRHPNAKRTVVILLADERVDGAQEQIAILWSAVDEVAADDQVERLGLHAEHRRPATPTPPRHHRSRLYISLYPATAPVFPV